MEPKPEPRLAELAEPKCLAKS